MDFFLCDHDHAERFPERLKSFVSSHSVLFLDFAPPEGRRAALIRQQALREISNGTAPPESLYSPEWLKKNRDKSVLMIRLVAADVYGTRKPIFLEAAAWPSDRSQEISTLWKSQNGSFLAARKEFARGNLDPAVAAWRSARDLEYKRLMIRDEGMLGQLLKLQRKYPDQTIGFIAGSFHTWPYVAAKERLQSLSGEYDVGYEFEPQTPSKPQAHTHIARATPTALEGARDVLRGLLGGSLKSAPESTEEDDRMIGEIASGMNWRELEELASVLRKKSPESDEDAGESAVAWMSGHLKIQPDEADRFRSSIALPRRP